MDVDKTKIKKLSQKERDDCVAQGKCFRCRQKGHQSRDCPTFTQTTAKAPSVKSRKATVEEVVEEEEEEEKPKKVKKTKQKKKASSRSSSPIPSSSDLPSYDEDQKARLLRHLVRHVDAARLEEIISQADEEEDF